MVFAALGSMHDQAIEPELSELSRRDLLLCGGKAYARVVGAAKVRGKWMPAETKIHGVLEATDKTSV